jgi:diguanylate cyclase (GGDEF)-like protein
VSSAGPGRALLVVREIDARQLGFEKNPVSTGARFDVLTGLPNRQSFAQRLNDRLQKHGTDHKIAVFRININQFAEIGNLLGTGAAEELIKGLAERLLTLTERGNGIGASLLGTMASVGRLDADALGVMTSGVRSRTDCFTVVERLRRMLEVPVVHDGRELRSTFNIGISVAPGDGLEAETLLRAAAVAAAAASAEEGAKLYSKTLQVQSLRRLDLENHLRRAIHARELKLHYQPKVDLKTHMVVGFEALLRWNSAEFGNISPIEIIPLAEQTGLIAPIGEWVIEQACADLGLWRADGFPKMTVAVNVSAEQFHATDMNQLASRAIRAAGIPADALELELTESCLMRDHRRAMVVFGMLRDLGCHLSIDDFGTGYSSLQYLRRLPVHSLKIDRSFVKDLPGDTGALAICRTVIALGRSLNLEVVAEGVETIDQAETVARRGATQAQGYLLAKPMKGEDVLPWLKRGEWRTTLADVDAAGATRQLQHLLKDPFED